MCDNGKLFAVSIVTIILLCPYTLSECCSGLAFGLTVSQRNANTIVVPDNCQSIPIALEKANAGDTIFVKSGSYYVPPNTMIDKPLSLIGEDPQATFIDGKIATWSMPGNIITFKILSPNVLISGFTLTNCSTAISVWNGSDCQIKNNIIKHNAVGISFEQGERFLISNNAFLDNGEGIIVFANTRHSTGNISANQFRQNKVGINLESSGVNVSENIISSSKQYGLLLVDGSYGVFNNSIINSLNVGLQFSRSTNNTLVCNNEFRNNSVGINLENFQITRPSEIGSGNEVYANNFIDNQQNAYVEHAYVLWSNNRPNGTDIVIWDNGENGNYWGDYQSRYLNITEIDASGIGNTPYIIDESNADNYPLMKQAQITPGENQPNTFLEIPMTMIAIIVVVVVLVFAVFIIIYRSNKAKK